MSGLIALLASGGPGVAEALTWEKRLAPIVAQKAGRGEARGLLARALGVKLKTVEKKFYAYEREGLIGLLNKRSAGKKFWKVKKARHLSESDKHTLKTWCENYQRSSATAIDDLLVAWRNGEVLTSTPVNAKTGYPHGWSKRTLHRYKPSEYELVAARQGRSAAAKHRPLVYTTRRGLYVGQYKLFDDIWHDEEVNLLDTRQSGRPLEFHGLDLASAYKMCWGIKMRRMVDGANESLNEREFRFLLAAHLFTTGYHRRGTTLILENRTTNISELIERLLTEGTRTAECPKGAITVQRGAMSGAAAHAGQYAGRPKGNFRFKAALESLGNLIHNKLSFLEAQTGKDRNHCPEELHGLNKYNDALLVAVAKLPAERAKWLIWPKRTLQQFRLIAADIYAQINDRTEHKLEGWDDHYVPDRQTGRMRRMSPLEVYRPGARALQPISEELCALIIGTDGGKERTIRRGMFELTDSELSGDVQRFDATDLPPRGKFLTVINPFDPDSLWIFDAKGRPVKRCQRIFVPCRADHEAVVRQIARSKAQETKLLAPMQARHTREARRRAAMHKHNAQVVDMSRPFTAEEKLDAKERRALTAPMTAFLTEDGSDPYAADAPAVEVSCPILSDNCDDEDAPTTIASMEDFL